ncbi:TBC1 domain family member 20-like [Varroa jacobsoni]|uniref:Rab-GAP TBC domain-containing protein n=1 Tax=Varroa destructor TaxID=109461 RepID=A0A7M7K3E1_VARDE|nr:TBC1 domain family member 20-like isoform X1 [Varroa destructor]XP_022698783.1 TBC1 domain family member 20-like [Varroa jacobsoni]
MKVPSTLSSLRDPAEMKCVPGLTAEDVLVKKDKIRGAIRVKDVPLLRRLSIEAGGLLEDALREDAWPILLGIDHSTTTCRNSKPTRQQLKSTPFHEQVVRDVNRTIRRFPPSIPRKMRLSLQESLLAVISRVLTAIPELHYYQGYHDICVTVLLVVNGNEEAAFRIMEHLSQTKLRAFMESSINGTTRQLGIIYPLLGAVNPSLRRFLENTSCGVVFLLPWCLTWYGHELSHYPTLTRLFDLFMSSVDLMPVYLAAAIVLPHQEKLLKQECSLANVHAYLGQVLPLLQCSRGDMEDRVVFAKDLLRRFPPASLFTMESDHQTGPFSISDTSIGWEKVDSLERKQVATFLLEDYVIVTYRRESTESVDFNDEVDRGSDRQPVEFMTTAC